MKRYRGSSPWFAPLTVRISTILLLTLSMSLLGCWKEPGKFDFKNAPGAEQYERLMWQAIQEKNWNEVEHHLAPAFVGVSATGQKLDRAGWVEYWKDLQITDFSLGETAVNPNGPDMVITYDLHLKGSVSAPATAIRVVSVWQQLKNGWILILESVTPVQ